MANISFIAILIGAAGVAGGIERGNMVGIMAAAVIHIGGIVGMTIENRMKGDYENMEDKQKIIKAFAEVMKMARNYSDTASIDYYVKDGVEEFAMVTFESGGKG